jgi:hypothetical protein
MVTASDVSVPDSSEKGTMESYPGESLVTFVNDIYPASNQRGFLDPQEWFPFFVTFIVGYKTP